MNRRKVTEEWAREGKLLEAARISKKRSDKKYTQKYVAGLVNKDQNYWTQWQKGTTRILDEYWLVFANELDFDPFETRPQLLEKKRALDYALAKSSKPGIAEPTRPSSYKRGIDITQLASELSETEKRKMIQALSRLATTKEAAWAASIFIDRTLSLLD